MTHPATDLSIFVELCCVYPTEELGWSLNMFPFATATLIQSKAVDLKET